VNSDEYEYGLFNPHNGIFETDRPDSFVSAVTQHLKCLGFEIIGTKEVPTEIFIYAVNDSN